MENNNKIGLVIKSIIKKRGITQKHLSERLDIPQTTISGYLSGNRTIPYDVVVRMAKVLNLDLNMLFNIQSDYVMNEDEHTLIVKIRELNEEQRQSLYYHIIGIIETLQK